MEDVAYDTVDDFQASDVHKAQSAGYNYITGDEVVTHTNEAYITSTGGKKMSENEAYGHTTYPGETCTVAVHRYSSILFLPVCE